MSDNVETVTVWDPLVRILHWVLVVAFFVAYFTEDDFEVVHVWAGHVVAAYVIIRVVWGLVGPRHARFSDFVYRPGMVFGYLTNLVRLRSKRYVGHSPAGGAMVVALLVSLAITVGAGLLLDASEDRIGPFADLIGGPAPAVTQPVDGSVAAGVRGEHREDLVEEVHEVFANLTLFLVIVHIAGVLLASYAHHENLARAMVTGRKRRED